MYVFRDIMYCKPGKVRPMVEKFKTMAAMSEKAGWGRMRIMTDVSAERYWTVVAEFETESLDKAMSMEMPPEVAKEMEAVMKDYHDLVDYGRREIYRVEA